MGESEGESESEGKNKSEGDGESNVWVVSCEEGTRRWREDDEEEVRGKWGKERMRRIGWENEVEERKKQMIKKWQKREFQT